VQATSLACFEEGLSKISNSPMQNQCIHFVYLHTYINFNFSTSYHYFNTRCISKLYATGIHISLFIITLFFLVGCLTTMLLLRIHKVGLKMLLEQKGEKPRGILCIIQAYILLPVLQAGRSRDRIAMRWIFQFT
jgi:hypothetical protein